MQRLKTKSVVDQRFEIVDSLGEGGMGIVYKAIQLDLARTVALKFLLPHLVEDDNALGRLRQEAEALSTLNHRNITLFYGYGMVHGRAPYIAMEYLDAPTLADVLLREGGRLSWRRTMQICRQIADAVAHAHRNGIIHRDLKPANVFVLEDDRVKVSDFGLAKIIDECEGLRQKLTQTGYTLGTPHYMSPEQAQGRQITPAADVYSLGCIMYQCLFGRPPFDAPSLPEVLFEQSHHDARLPTQKEEPALPPDAITILTRSLRKQPEDRFESMELMRDAIDRMIADNESKRDFKTRFVGGVHSIPSRSKKPKKWMVAATFGVALLAVAGFFITAQFDSTKDQRELEEQRRSGNYFAAADIDMRRADAYKKNNLPGLQQEALSDLVQDFDRAVNSKAYTEMNHDEQSAFICRAVDYLIDLKNPAGPVVDKLYHDSTFLQAGPESNRYFNMLCAAFQHPLARNDAKTRSGMRHAINMLRAGKQDPHYKQLMRLMTRMIGNDYKLTAAQYAQQSQKVRNAIARSDYDEAAACAVPLIYDYCLNDHSTERSHQLEEVLEALNTVPAKSLNEPIWLVISNGNQVLSTYYSAVGGTDAIAFYTKALANEMNTPKIANHAFRANVCYRLAEAYRSEGDSKRAAEFYERTIKEVLALGNGPDGRVTCCLLALGKFDEVLAQPNHYNHHAWVHPVDTMPDDQKVLRSTPSKENLMRYAIDLTTRAQARARHGQLRQAGEDLAEAVHTFASVNSPGPGWNMNAAACTTAYAADLYRQGKFDETRKYANLALSNLRMLRDPKAEKFVAAYNYQLAWLFYGVGDSSQALQLMRNAPTTDLTTSREYPDQLLHAGLSKLYEGKLDAAERDLRFALTYLLDSHIGSYPPVMAALAKVFSVEGKHADAKRLAREAVALSPYPRPWFLPDFVEAERLAK